MYVPSAVKLLDLVEVEETDSDFVAVEEEDELTDFVVVEEDFAVGEEESLSREPQVSAALSSTSWAERDTDGLRVVSPGSSTAVSS